ncbi:MAG: hypothetical protein EBV07_00735, partial [Proteobacteria bacterium]|nr:hypothetical protein [Pseudomonadota bacterium]
SKNPILEKFVDLTYKTLGDPNFRKDPKKFLKENGKKLLISTLKEVVNKTDFYKKYAIQKILGVEVEIDFVDLIFDPKVTLKAIAKKIAITHLSNILNNLLRRTLENSFRRYLAIKRLAWRIINRFKNRVAIAASNFATRYMGAIGVRIAQWIASAAGLAVPGVGWIVTAVLTILPIILRPILGDKDLGQIFKDFMKFLLLGPCLFMFFIYFTIVLPIVTLFGNFFTDLWHAITGEGSNYYFNDERFNEALLTDRTFGGIRGSYGSYNLGDEMISGLVTTSGNSCIDELKRPKHAAKAMNKWNNLKPNDFQGITGPAEVNCRVMCNAQKSMATLFPGIPSDSGLNLLNCSATEVGQARFNPEKAYGDALQRYWCTYAVTDAYAEDFPDIATSDNASVSVLNAWFKIKITQGAPFRRIDPGQLSGQCFSKDELMSGAAIIMSGTSDCSLSDDNHAALFLKFEGNTFVYMNSNSGSLRETVDVVDCGGGKVRLNPKVYRNKKNEITLTLNFCSFYQIDSTKFNTAGKTCPTNCVPDVNNYKYE